VKVRLDDGTEREARCAHIPYTWDEHLLHERAREERDAREQAHAQGQNDALLAAIKSFEEITGFDLHHTEVRLEAPASMVEVYDHNEAEVALSASQLMNLAHHLRNRIP
jgi:hypothetical protein